LEIEIWDLFGICDLEFEVSEPPEGTGFFKSVEVSLQKMKFVP
jgi:hypothetical protein